MQNLAGSSSGCSFVMGLRLLLLVRPILGWLPRLLIVKEIVEITVAVVEIESAHPLGRPLPRLQHALRVGLLAAKF